jgi:predicted metal-binding transcription factor (methanogenesis marker protein 9)
MDKKIKSDIKDLMKLGIPEDMAIICACAMNKKPELAEDYVEELKKEQNEIKDFLKEFVTFEEVNKIIKDEEHIEKVKVEKILIEDINEETEENINKEKKD